MACTEPIVRCLRTCPVFSGYPEEALRALVRGSRVVSLARDETLFREGDPCRAAYCIDEGLLRLAVIGPDGEERTVARLGPGQSFAEEAIFSGQGYSATACAEQRSRLVEIDAAALAHSLRERPALAWQMLAVMSQRVDRLLVKLRALSLQGAGHDVYGALLKH